MIKFLKHLFLILLLVGIQLAVAPNSVGYLGGLNVVLAVLIFIGVIRSFTLGAIYAFILGFILDLYSALPFGANLLAFLLAILIVNKIAVHFLTNKSLYSLIGMNVLAVIAYALVIYLFQVVFNLAETGELIFDQIAANAPRDLLRQAVYNSILSALLFAFFHLTSRRFKTVFIDTTKG